MIDTWSICGRLFYVVIVMRSADHIPSGATCLLTISLFRARSFTLILVQNVRAGFLNAVYFRRGLTCTIGLTNDLIDGGQLRAKNGF